MPARGYNTGTPAVATSADVLTDANGSQWRTYTATLINGKATGQTTIVPVTSGKRFIPLDCRVILREQTGTPGVVATLGIGTVSSTYTNIAAAAALTGLDAANEVFAVVLATGLTAVSINSEPIRVNVTVAATVWTTYVFDVILAGILVS